MAYLNDYEEQDWNGIRMKNRIRALTGLLVSALFFCGCSIGGREVTITNGLESQEVFKIGSEICTLPQAKLYLANYQNMYGKSYEIDLWEQGFQKKKLRKYIKEITLSEMTKIVCMELLAKNQDISLSQEEKQDIKEAAKVYYQSLNEEELAFTGAAEADVVSMYEDYALASKVYHVLTEGVDEEVSDDEARIMEAMQIYVKNQAEADEVAAKLEAGEDFSAVASNYNQKPAIEITFGRGEMPKEVENEAFELDNEEVSSCIPADEGFYFMKCINKFNEELTDANKFKIVEAREKEAFDDTYEEFVSGLSSELNQEAWDDIVLVTDGSITTDSFFETIEEALN